MRLQKASSRWRVVLVVAASAAAFIALAFLIYWPYVANITAIYDPRLKEGLTTLKVVFYLAFAVHLIASFGTATALILWLRTPRHPAFTGVAVTFAVLMLPLMLYLSRSNACTAFVSFPIPGFFCDH